MHLCARTPLQITHDDFDFAANPPLGYSDLEGEVESSKFYSADNKRSLITVLSQLVKLCICLTDVPSFVYSDQHSEDARHKDLAQELARIWDGRKALASWSERTLRVLPACSRIPHSPTDINASNFYIFLYSELLWLYYE